ncbi:MAG: DUF1559 domain-containing protein [Pirellulales bacterium]|nr:DUF1559 domain-containing protein [Pirellulales bacterium]
MFAATGLVVAVGAAGGLWIASRGRPEKPTASAPAVEVSAPVVNADPKTVPADAAVPPGDRPTLDPRWIPGKARVIASMDPNRLATEGSLGSWLARLGPLWPDVWRPLAEQFDWQPTAIRRVTHVQWQAGGSPSDGVTLVEFLEPVAAESFAGTQEVADLRHAGRPARRAAEGGWSNAWIIVDEHRAISGPDTVLRELTARQGPLPEPSKLIDLAQRGGQFAAAVAVDLGAWRASGERIALPELAWLTTAVPPWEALAEAATAGAIWITPGEAFQVEVRLVAGTESATLDLENTWQQALAASRAFADGESQGLDGRLQRGELTPDAADHREFICKALVAAFQSATSGHERDEFWARCSPGTTTEKFFAALLAGVPSFESDLRAGQRLAALGHVRGAAAGLLAHQRATGQWPIGAGGAVQLRPESRLSWIASLLPYYGHRELHKQLNFFHSWNDPVNRAAASEPLAEFVNPLLGATKTEAGFPITHYVGVAGLGADAGELPPTDPRAGVFSFRRQLRPEEIVDGATNTIALLGVRERLGAWAAGGDATVRALTQRPYVNGPDGFGSGQEDGMYAAMLDGAVRFVSKDVDPQVLEQMATINGGGRPTAAELALLPLVDEHGVVATAPRAEPPVAAPTAETAAHDQPQPPSEPATATPAPSPPALSDAEIAARLGVELPAIAAESTPLAALVDVIADLTAVPISIDVDALAAEGISVSDTVKVQLNGATAGEALRAAIEALGLVELIQSGQVVITTATQMGQDLSERSYDLAALAGDLAPESTARAIQLVERFIAPATWQAAGGSGTLRAAKNKLVVRQTQNVHQELAALVARLGKLRSRSGGDPRELTCRALLAAAPLATPLTVSHPQPVALSRLLADLQAASGVNLVIDHRALEALGLTESAEVTLRADQLPLSEALAVALGPLDLAYRAIDAQTLQITSRAALAASLETEVYAVPPNLRQKYPGATMEEALRRDVAPLAWQGNGGTGDLAFDPGSNALLVLNNQDIQVQVVRWLIDQATAPGSNR